MHRVQSCYKLTLQEIGNIEKVISGSRLENLPHDKAIVKLRNSLKYMIEIVAYLELLEKYYESAYNKPARGLTDLIQEFNKDLDYIRKNALIEETRLKKDLSKGELLIQDYGNRQLFGDVEEKIRGIVIKTKEQINRLKLELD